MRRAWQVGLLLAASALPACGGGADQPAPTSTTARRPTASTTSTSVVTTTSSTATPSTTVRTTAVPAVAAPIYFLTSLGGAGTVGWYAIGADGGSRRRIYGGEGTEPALAPGRARLAFGRGAEVVVRPVSGTGTTVARAPSGTVVAVAWSPDGHTLAFATRDDSAPAGVFVVPVAGGEPRRLGDQPVQHLAWSPDSRTVAGAGEDGLWLYPVSGAPPVHLRELRAFEVAWSSRDVLAVQLDDKHVHVMGPGGGGDRDVGEGLRPRWSPDGRTLAFTGNEGNQTVVAVVPASGGTPRHLTAPNDRGREPVWSPDGRFLAYVSLGQDQVYRLFRASPDGSARRLLTAQQDVELLVW